MIVPSEGWYEWTVENGKKQPWFITLREDKPLFMAALTNWTPLRPFSPVQTVETGIVIVTQDAEGGIIDVHDRRPVVLEPADARKWLDPETPVEKAAQIAQSRSLPSDRFMWWKVDRKANRPEKINPDRDLLTPCV